MALTYRTDIGPLGRVGEIAGHLQDLDTAINLGERWGIRIAEAASYQELINRITRQGPGAVEDAARGAGYRVRDLAAVEEWIHTGWRPWKPGRFPYRDPGVLIQALADYQISNRLGTRLQTHRIIYENPLEVVLTGSGFLIAGTIYLLRMIRDWSSARRTARANANEAEAHAQQAQARASLAWTEADILRWFADEARAGRWHMPPGDLLSLARPEDMAALNRLAAGNVTLELPQGLDSEQPET